MLPTVTAWGFTLDVGLALLLLYVTALWLGGWLLEFLAVAHFHRAQPYAHTAFAYDVELDRYECPQGELLTLPHIRRPEQAGHLQGPGCVVQPMRAQGVLCPARRRSARLPLPCRISRDRRRAILPLALGGHPCG